MVTLEDYKNMGFALELLAQSPYHRQYKLGDYYRTEVLPAIWADQTRFYLTEQGTPAALVTWAWINEDLEKELHATGRSLKNSEWAGGDRVFVNDWLSPYGGLRNYVRDMMDNIFPEVEFATSLRRNPDGSVRRINHWKRPEIRKIKQVVTS